MRFDIPYAARGQKIGLLGGSFDPAHAGHLHISEQALVRFKLDQVWWLVSPGNPLKEIGPAPMVQRVERANLVADHPRIQVTTLETRLETRYTIDTLRGVQGLYPQVHFTWIMGADNLVQLHHWRDWQQIVQMMPIGVLARPGSRLAARRSVAARVFARNQIPGGEAGSLARQTAPAWCFLNMPMRHESSSKIRANGNWG